MFTVTRCFISSLTCAPVKLLVFFFFLGVWVESLCLCVSVWTWVCGCILYIRELKTTVLSARRCFLFVLVNITTLPVCYYKGNIIFLALLSSFISNFTLQYMPLPLSDITQAYRCAPEKTDQALTKVRGVLFFWFVMSKSAASCKNADGE